VQQLNIDLGTRSYPIVIGEDVLADRKLLARLLPHTNLLIVTNDTVARLHLPELIRGLGDRTAAIHTLPDGEEFKNHATLNSVFDALASARLHRDGAIVALGGGVVGDIGGFAAACYQRGIAYLQVPTTLLAQVDSAVGGKTGINHAAGKNLIGAFHQPIGVLSDITTLRTLPPRELRAGLAEVIKYGLIEDLHFLEWIERSLEKLLTFEPAAFEHAIRRSCEIKARIVAADEREQGARALLNLGHTFGHAIEAAGEYRTWLHGEAVALGLLMAVSMSARLGWLVSSDVQRVKSLLERAGLPTSAPGLDAGRVLELMQLDKKIKNGHLRLVLLPRLGAASVSMDFDPGQLRDTLQEFLER
jgi:3-dehydroquinate synthase